MSTSKSSSKDSAISSTSTQKSRAPSVATPPAVAAASAAAFAGSTTAASSAAHADDPPRRPGVAAEAREAHVATQRRHGVQARRAARPTVGAAAGRRRRTATRPRVRARRPTSVLGAAGAAREEAAGQVDEALAGVAAAARRRVASVELGVALLQERREALSGRAAEADAAAGGARQRGVDRHVAPRAVLVVAQRRGSRARGGRPTRRREQQVGARRDDGERKARASPTRSHARARRRARPAAPPATRCRRRPRERRRPRRGATRPRRGGDGESGWCSAAQILRRSARARARARRRAGHRDAAPRAA